MGDPIQPETLITPPLNLEDIEDRLASRTPEQTAARQARLDTWLLGRDAMAIGEHHLAAGDLDGAREFFVMAARHHAPDAEVMLGTVVTRLAVAKDPAVTAEARQCGTDNMTEETAATQMPGRPVASVRAAAIQLDGHDFDDLCDHVTRWQGNEDLQPQHARFVSPTDEPVSHDYTMAYWLLSRADMVLARRFLTAIGVEYQVVRDLASPGASVVLTDYLSPGRENPLGPDGSQPGATATQHLRKKAPG